LVDPDCPAVKLRAIKLTKKTGIIWKTCEASRNYRKFLDGIATIPPAHSITNQNKTVSTEELKDDDDDWTVLDEYSDASTRCSSPDSRAEESNLEESQQEINEMPNLEETLNNKN